MSVVKCANRGFTLVEVVVSLLILAIMFGGILLAFQRTSDHIVLQNMRSRAAGVAQRRMELLLADRTEPNDSQLHGEDEIYPSFSWRLALERQVVSESTAPGRAAAAVIWATVLVESSKSPMQSKPLAKLVRCFSTLKPLPGGKGLSGEQDSQEEAWIEELTERLGREPTFDEIMAELVLKGALGAEEAEKLKSGEKLDVEEEKKD
ncbi:MAG: type II secretion system protein [Sedimentisphaerales bacterium]|nr:type II secretion system protein [Sedimentisphaerales bacterium]